MGRDNPFTERFKYLDGLVADEREVLTELQIVAMLYGAGALILGEPRKLKLHDEHPDAPENLVYLSIRKPPKGNLTDIQLRAIGRHLAANYVESMSDPDIVSPLPLDAEYVVGLPEAGEPIAEGFVSAWAEFTGVELTQLHLKKKMVAGYRMIVPGPKVPLDSRHNGKVIMIDDVCSGGRSMLEAAQALVKMGLYRHFCAVFMDREQGGRQLLYGHGIEFFSSLTGVGLLDPEIMSRINQSLTEMDKFLVAHHSLEC
jgi:pyrimidine operon attenuation protein/uracil phosphoribosyltransferase